jgi:hypothetical protein
MNKYRLTSSAFERKDPFKDPLRVIFLSVEGTTTEIDYFKRIHEFREELGIAASLTIETLNKGDTNSDPLNVLELLEEYVDLRDKKVPKELMDIKAIAEKYPEQFITDYLQNPETLEKRKRKEFADDLSLISYDIAYRKYLSEVGNSANDVFGIVINCEGKNATDRKIKVSKALSHCIEMGYLCILSNPCFEFWLLLHLCDMKDEYANSKQAIEENAKVSKQHTFVSQMLSQKAHHNKSITKEKFIANYLHAVDTAITNSQVYATTSDEILCNIGTNMLDFFSIARQD